MVGFQGQLQDFGAFYESTYPVAYRVACGVERRANPGRGRHAGEAVTRDQVATVNVHVGADVFVAEPRLRWPDRGFPPYPSAQLVPSDPSDLSTRWLRWCGEPPPTILRNLRPPIRRGVGGEGRAAHPLGCEVPTPGHEEQDQLRRRRIIRGANRDSGHDTPARLVGT
jgi:hypothetical protein